MEELIIMKKLKVISIVMIIVLSFCCVSINTFAAETDSYNTNVLNDCSVVDDANYTEILNGSIQTYSLSKPTKYYNLANLSYKASLEVVGNAWLYTNYYFYPNSSGTIYVNYTIYSDTGRATKMKIGFYDLTDNEWDAYYTTNGSTISGISGKMYAYNLDKGHKYAVAFYSVYDGWTHDTVHGSAVISHS